MAVTQLNTANYDYAMMLSTLNKSYKGKADITLSAYTTTAAPDVKVGSVFDCNGAIFIVDTTDITPTGYAGITNSTTFYLYWDEDPGAFIYSNTAPTWSDALQGWYNGNDRAFFSMYKDSGGTLYQNKNKYNGRYKEKPMIYETKTVSGAALGASATSDINVTGFSFNPTAVLDAKIFAYAGNEHDADEVYESNLFGRSNYVGTTTTVNYVRITNVTMGAALVTVRVANDYAATLKYRLVVTATGLD